MSLAKRLRVLLAAWRQEWHQKTCDHCRTTWWVEGRDHRLISVCDACESALLDRMANDLERDYLKRQRYLKEAI
jgi:hypothetical protein